MVILLLQQNIDNHEQKYKFFRTADIWSVNKITWRGKIAGSSAIKIQIRVTLIANLLLSVLQSKIERRWSFSGLATIVRIMLMYYLNLEKLLNQPDADWKIMIAEAADSPPDNSDD